jgi:streptomycin 6-kinase
MNPLGRVLSGDQPEDRMRRRIAILAERLGRERLRLRDWAFAHAVLSAWWSVEDSEDWRYAIHCAELFDRVE